MLEASPSTASAAPASRLTLAEAYEQAAKADESLRLAALDVRTAEADRFEPWTTMLPRTSFSGSAIGQQGVTRADVRVQPHTQWIWNASVEATLLRLGLWDELQSTSHRLAARKLEQTRAQQALMFDVASVFISVLRARQQLQLAEAAQQRASAQVTAAEARLKAGAALKTTVLLSTLERRRAQLVIVENTKELRSREIAFERLIGIPPPAMLVIPAPPPLPRLPAALERANNRADLRAVAELVAATEEALAGARKGRLRPELGVRADAAHTDPFPAVREQHLDYRVQGLLTFRVYDGGSEYLAIRRARIARDAAREDLSARQKAVSEEVRQAHLRFESLQQSATLAREQVKDARENLTLVEGQFKLGAATPLEVANALALLAEAENLELVALYDQQLATYDLLFASGLIEL